MGTITYLYPVILPTTGSPEGADTSSVAFSHQYSSSVSMIGCLHCYHGYLWCDGTAHVIGCLHRYHTLGAMIPHILDLIHYCRVIPGEELSLLFRLSSVPSKK